MRAITIVRVGTEKFRKNNFQFELNIQTKGMSSYTVYTSSLLPLLQKRYIELHVFFSRPVNYVELLSPFAGQEAFKT